LKVQAAAFESAGTIEVEPSNEYAAVLMNSIVTGEPSVIYGNLQNNGCISQLPGKCAVEVPCLVDDNGVQPTIIGDLPPQLVALIRTNINVQELTVAALMEENREHIFHAAMLDPHTAAELDLEQIWAMTEELIRAHGNWLPAWTHNNELERVA
jgi:alpha-galactosidase